MMWLSAVHVAPRGFDAVVSAVTVPSTSENVFSTSPAKNPIPCSSGEKNGWMPPSDLGILIASTSSRPRTYSQLSAARYATHLPRGDKASEGSWFESSGDRSITDRPGPLGSETASLLD